LSGSATGFFFDASFRALGTERVLFLLRVGPPNSFDSLVAALFFVLQKCQTCRCFNCKTVCLTVLLRGDKVEYSSNIVASLMIARRAGEQMPQGVFHDSLNKQIDKAYRV